MLVSKSSLLRRHLPMTDSAPPDPTQGKHAVFSFFSGAGFLDLGFEKAGFEIAFANELNAEFVEGYRHSRAKMGLPLPRYGIACDLISFGAPRKYQSN